MTYEEIFAKTKEKVMSAKGVDYKGHLAVQVDMGKLDSVKAFTVGKLKVEGSVDKALEFSKIVNSLNKAEEKPKASKPAPKAAAKEKTDSVAPAKKTGRKK